jgi:hypothetical protein
LNAEAGNDCPASCVKSGKGTLRSRISLTLDAGYATQVDGAL